MADHAVECGCQQFERLMELGAILSRQKDFGETLRLVAQKATALVNADTASIKMINPQTRNTVKTIFRNGREQSRRQYREIHTFVSGWILKNRQSFKSSDLQKDTHFKKGLFSGSPVKSALGTPLVSEGVVFGTLIVLNCNAESASTERALADLEKLATIAAPYLRNVQKIQEYFEARMPKTTLRAKYEAVGLLGKSDTFMELLQAIEAAASCDVRVLLEGESGTGKELIARAIHQFSSRSDAPFVAIDCGAIPGTLIESELFGHTKGAFTGATSERKGLFEEADQGTLFMDEISNLPLELQAKLTRALQEGEVRPLGGNETRKMNVRVLSASSSPLQKLVDAQGFREDLFYRLHVYPIQIPSLDDRQEDIPLLAGHFLSKFAALQKKSINSFHEEMVDFMKMRAWSGNIRQLENFVERLVTLTGGEKTVLDRTVLPKDLNKELQKLESSNQDLHVSRSLNDMLGEYEEQVIRKALTSNNWNQSGAARSLKISEQTLRYKMAKLRIVRPRHSALSA